MSSKQVCFASFKSDCEKIRYCKDANFNKQENTLQIFGATVEKLC